MPDYAHPDLLVSTAWVADHLTDPQVRIVESDEDRALYTQGHIPGAVEIDWQVDLQNQVVRDYIDRAAFEKLCAERGISNDTTVVFYGDKNNWWACYALWVFKLYGHKDCRVMNGGRKRWELDGRAWSNDRVTYPHAHYTAAEQDGTIRALRDEVLKHQRAGKQLLDDPNDWRRLDDDDVAADLVEGRHRLGQGARLGHHQHVRQHDGEGLVADDVPGAPDGVTQAQGRHLAHEAHLAGLGQVATDVGQDVQLALGLQLGLEFDVVVEIVLDGTLAAAGDEDEVLDPRRPALLDDVGQDRAVDDVQHFLGRDLGPGKHPRAQSRHRQHRLAHLA